MPVRSSSWPFVPVKEAFERSVETVLPKTLIGAINYIGLENIAQNNGQLVGNIVNDDPASIKSLKNVFEPDHILYGKLRPNLNKVWLSDRRGICSTDIFVISPKTEKVEPYLYSYIFRDHRFNELVVSQVSGAQLPRIGWKSLAGIQVPLPPMEVQEEIVAEIEGYQKVINGARAVVENYRPQIHVDPDWPMVELGDFAALINGRAYRRNELLDEGKTPVLRVGNFFSNRKWYYSDLELPDEKYCDNGDLLYAWSASFGPQIWKGPRAIYHYHIWKVETSKVVDKKFLYYILQADTERIKAEGHGIAMIHATKRGMEKREFPLPPLATQRILVSEMETEQALVEANHELIERFEKKIEHAIAGVWNE